MKIAEFNKQVDQVKQAFEQAEKTFDCDEVKLVFKTDDGEMIPINCIEGGFAPNMDTHVLIFSTGKEELMELLNRMLGSMVVDADDIDVGEKFEGAFNDDNH